MSPEVIHLSGEPASVAKSALTSLIHDDTSDDNSNKELETSTLSSKDFASVSAEVVIKYR